MQLEQNSWLAEDGWAQGAPGYSGIEPQMVLIFFGVRAWKESKDLRGLRSQFPNTLFIGCSTAGEITDIQVNDDSLSYMAIEFERTTVKHQVLPVESDENSHEAGAQLAKVLMADDLRHVFVFSDGLRTNGSTLVEAIAECLPTNVSISGGMAGDGTDYNCTYIMCDGNAETAIVGAVGLYGDSLKVGCGSMGGWDSFGTERLITRSEGRILYELDGQSALALYKNYLGDYARNLESAITRFPLSIRLPGKERAVVRGVVGVNEEEDSISFAGDMPQGGYARLMTANFERLIDGAAEAAEATMKGAGDGPPDLALLVSCVGRRVVLGQRTEEEIEAVREVFGDTTRLIGFYSYGEVSPFSAGERCEFHNETMTITTLTEV